MMKIARNVVVLTLLMRGQFPVGFRSMEVKYDHEYFSMLQNYGTSLGFFVDFSMLSYKGSSGIFVAISDTTRILLPTGVQTRQVY